MGMAASQARLLSITARLTNNENTGQAVSYSKQRLADQTQQITNEYNEALNATKLTVLTGFNGADANYTDISYNLMTGLHMAESTKQYVVTDTKGRILVTNEIADAYEKSRGNYNTFLGALGYSQADITVNKNSTDKDAKIKTMQQIHEAWDKYFETIGVEVGGKDDKDKMHPFNNRIDFSWTPAFAMKEIDGKNVYVDAKGNEITATTKEELEKKGTSYLGDGYAGYVITDDDGNYLDINNKKIEKDVDKDGDGVNDDYSDAALARRTFNPISYEGTTPESRDLYDYAMAITEAYLSDKFINNQKDKDTAINTAADSDNAAALKYYRNIFDKIQACGYFTYTNTPAKIDKNHIYASEGTGKVQKDPMKDNYTFEQLLRNGTLRLEYYSSTDRGFKSTTISEDNCIQEVADERAIAKAESKYNQDMADLEQKDNKFDLDLKRLDTEHKALETEYESVKSVVDKNIESSFKIFS